MTKSKKENVDVRNFVARDMMDGRFKSKRFSNDRGNRRAKDARNSWKNQDW